MEKLGDRIIYRDSPVPWWTRAMIVAFGLAAILLLALPIAIGLSNSRLEELGWLGFVLLPVLGVAMPLALGCVAIHRAFAAITEMVIDPAKGEFSMIRRGPLGAGREVHPLGLIGPLQSFTRSHSDFPDEHVLIVALPGGGKFEATDFKSLSDARLWRAAIERLIEEARAPSKP